MPFALLTVAQRRKFEALYEGGGLNCADHLHWRSRWAGAADTDELFLGCLELAVVLAKPRSRRLDLREWRWEALPRLWELRPLLCNLSPAEATAFAQR